MAYDVSKTNHVPMRVLFGTAGSEVELGFTAPGEITVSFAEEWVEQMAHQTGNRLLEAYAKPGSPTITVELLEVTNLANWAIAFPNGSAQNDGGANNRFSPTLITAGASTPHIGQKATAIAKRLILRPVTTASSSTDDAGDLWFPKAFVSSVGDMQFSVDVSHVLGLTFRALYVEAATEGEHLWLYGKSAGNWVDA